MMNRNDKDNNNSSKPIMDGESSLGSLDLQGSASFLKPGEDGDNGKSDSNGSLTEEHLVLPSSLKKQQQQQQKNRKQTTTDGHRSVSFATGTLDNENNDASLGIGRVAKIKDQLLNNFHDSFNRSWGGNLGVGLGDDDSTSSSSDDDDSMDDSLGDFGADMMDKSETYQAVRKGSMSMSFNMSFMQIANENDDYEVVNRYGKNVNIPKKVTGRGSLFVIADEKFGNTKVVQSRLEKAALKLQRFFRRCLLVLRQFNEELDYLENEIKDIESRRLEELGDVKTYIQEEKKQFRMQLEEEMNKDLWTEEEWAAFHKEQDDLKQHIGYLKEEATTLKRQCKELKRENSQLEIVDPEKEAARARLEEEIKRVTDDNDDWDRIGRHYKDSVDTAQKNIDILTEKRIIKRTQRKKLKETIAKIAEMVDKRQQQENPKLAKKINKLKDKREKEMKKMKEETIRQLQGDEMSEEEKKAVEEMKRQKAVKKEIKRREKAKKRAQKHNQSLSTFMEEIPEQEEEEHEGVQHATARNPEAVNVDPKSLAIMASAVGSRATEKQPKATDDSPQPAGMRDTSKNKSKKSKRRSKVEKDVPSVIGISETTIHLENAELKPRRDAKTKKEKRYGVDLPDLAGMDNSGVASAPSDSENAEEAKRDRKKEKKQKKEKKKKKDKEKEKKLLEENVVVTRSSLENHGDAALMSILQSQAEAEREKQQNRLSKFKEKKTTDKELVCAEIVTNEKKSSKTKDKRSSSQDETPGASALRSLITG